MGERSLTPGAAPPTEKEIGETVLRRSDFDPQADSLVCKEMSRLREKLKQYDGKEARGNGFASAISVGTCSVSFGQTT